MNTGNIRFTAWLTDTSEEGIWSEYKNEDAIFAIGSPTVELFVASYNSMEKENKIILETERYGYKHNTSSENNWISITDNYGIYMSTLWIASPYISGYGQLQVHGRRIFKL